MVASSWPENPTTTSSLCCSITSQKHDASLHPLWADVMLLLLLWDRFYLQTMLRDSWINKTVRSGLKDGGKEDYIRNQPLWCNFFFFFFWLTSTRGRAKDTLLSQPGTPFTQRPSFFPREGGRKLTGLPGNAGPVIICAVGGWGEVRIGLTVF